MDIILIGYGRMGKEIEKIAVSRGHRIILALHEENTAEFTEENLKKADVAIEFTRPEAAPENVNRCLKAGTSIVSGTTGWNDKIQEAKDLATSSATSFIHASNFSPGVNLFFALNEHLAGLMQNFEQYDVSMTEIHHTKKLDAPSGTAITLAEGVLSKISRKKNWKLKEEAGQDDLSIKAIREGDVPGTHQIQYSSSIDDITITHEAHNRQGFALGAVLAAEYINGKTGVFTMRDVLKLNS